MTKIMVATVKPFAAAAVEGIRKSVVEAGYEFALLEKYDGQEALKAAVKDVDALIIRSDKITQEILDAASRLRIVVRAGAGYDNVDLEAASARNIVVMNTPGQNSNAVAELALGMMVFQARNHFNGKAGVELKGKTLGIHAFGHVGSLVARIAQGFGMLVYAYDPFISKDRIKEHGVVAVDSAEELYEKCQYVSLHIPANDKTRNSINFDLLNRMPQGATLVNTARKEVVNEEDLIKLMEQRPDFQYLSDIAPDNKEVIAKKFEGRFFFTPKKMGAQTAEANVNAGIAAANQIIGFLKEGNTTFQVN